MADPPFLHRVLPWATAAAYVVGIACTWRGDWGGWLPLAPLLLAAAALAVPLGRGNAALAVAANVAGCGAAAVAAHLDHRPAWAVVLWLGMGVLVGAAGMVVARGQALVMVLRTRSPGEVLAVRRLALLFAAIGIVQLAGLDSWWDVSIVVMALLAFIGIGSIASGRAAALLAWAGCWAAGLARAADVPGPVTPEWLEWVFLTVALMVGLGGGLLWARKADALAEHEAIHV